LSASAISAISISNDWRRYKAQRVHLADLAVENTSTLYWSVSLGIFAPQGQHGDRSMLNMAYDTPWVRAMFGPDQ